MTLLKILLQRLGALGAALSAHFRADTPAATVIADTQGHIIYWSDLATAAFGWNAADINGSPLSNILRSGDIDSEAEVRPFIRFPTTVRRCRVTCKAGCSAQADMLQSILADSEGEVIGQLVLLRTTANRSEAPFLSELHAPPGGTQGIYARNKRGRIIVKPSLLPALWG